MAAARLPQTVTKSWKVGQTVQQRGSQRRGPKTKSSARANGSCETKCTIFNSSKSDLKITGEGGGWG